MDMNMCEKDLKHCMQEIDFNNSAGAINFINKIVQIVEKYTGPHQFKFGPHQPKDPIV